MALSLRSLFIILFELVLLFSAMLLADFLEGNVVFIPEMLVKLPKVDYLPGDFRVVLAYFVGVHAVLFTVQSMRLGFWRTTDTQRTVEELYGLAIGFAVSALLLFVTSSIPYDANLVVGIALLTAMMFIGVHIVSATWVHRALFGSISRLLTGILKRAFTVSGIVILMVALSPALMAKMFVSDRDFANVITQIRIWFSQDEAVDYVFVNAFGERKFLQPMMIRSHPGDPARIYLLERHGRLFELDYPEGKDARVLLDISDKVGFVESENGALGFAFHPDFDRAGASGAGQIYLYYTSVHDGVQVNRLSRFTIDTLDAAAVSASEQSLMVLPREPSGFHNGGAVGFGADGFLYIALGEGVHPKSAKQQSETLRSGILRIDPDCKGGEVSQPLSRYPAVGETMNYCIPSDNPFVGHSGLLDEYWALGLRNPFRFSFDDRSGALWVGDVGSTKWEEVNLVRAGANYQFPFVEGYEPTGKSRPEMVLGEEQGPVYTYIHTAYDRAVIGGFVYQGDEFPDLRDRYLFADNYSSRIFAMPSTGERVERVEHVATANQYAQRGTSSLSQLPNGDLLLTTLGRSAVATGEVLKMVRSNGNPVVLPKPSEEEEVLSEGELREVYVTNCARCHGAKGDGRGPDSDLLQVDMPDFTSPQFQSRVSDEALRQVILEGGFGVGLSPMMPSWGHLLSEAEVKGLVELLRRFGPGR